MLNPLNHTIPSKTEAPLRRMLACRLSALSIAITLSLLLTEVGSADKGELGTDVRRTTQDTSQIANALREKYEIDKVTLSHFHTPGHIRGRLPKGFKKTTANEMMYGFFESNKDVFAISEPRENLIILQGGGDGPGGTCLKLGQKYKGVIVYGTGASICFDIKSGSFTFSGELMPEIELLMTPAIDKTEAETRAITYSRTSRLTAAIDATSELEIFVKKDSPRLAWRVKVRFESGHHWGMLYHIDAESGELLGGDEVEALPTEEKNGTQSNPTPDDTQSTSSAPMPGVQPRGSEENEVQPKHLYPTQTFKVDPRQAEAPNAGAVDGAHKSPDTLGMWSRPRIDTTNPIDPAKVLPRPGAPH